MTSARPDRLLDLLSLIGDASDGLSEALGPPVADRRVGLNRWLVYRGPGLTMRVRCRSGPDGSGIVAACTATFEPGAESLRAAASLLGLWPACAPDEPLDDAGREPRMLRRAIARPGGGLLSLTASVRGERIVALTLFDEAPDWV
ncbi:MAG: hypothetical protein ACE5HF_00185 [Gemmatimonadota bacterium]